MSNEDKQHVREGRAASAASQQQQQQTGSSKHTIASVTNEGADDTISAITQGLIQASQANHESSSQSITQSVDPSTAGQSMSRRRINAVITSKRVSHPGPDRNVSNVSSIQEPTIVTGNCELDSHADTSVADANFIVLEYTNQTCNASPFAKSYDQKQDVPIVKAATAYDDERTGITYILVLRQALYFGDEVEASLLCPNQLRSNGVIVDDIPIHLSHNNASTHSITFPHENVTLPLKLNGCFSYIPTRTPTTQEIKSCQWLILTSDAQWEPSLMPFDALEEAAINAMEHPEPHRNLYALERSPLKEIFGIFYDYYVLQTANISAMMTSPYKPRVNASKLAQRWCIGEAVATKTLKVTTQMGIRNCLYPIERHLRTKQSQLDILNSVSGMAFSTPIPFPPVYLL